MRAHSAEFFEAPLGACGQHQGRISAEVKAGKPKLNLARVSALGNNPLGNVDAVTQLRKPPVRASAGQVGDLRHTNMCGGHLRLEVPLPRVSINEALVIVERRIEQLLSERLQSRHVA